MFSNVSPTGDGDQPRPYIDALRERLESVGNERVIKETDLDRGIVETIEKGDVDAIEGIHLTEVAIIFGLANGESPEELHTTAREELLLAMTSAVIDIEQLTANVNIDLDPGALQAKLEGRFPMSLGEYARLRDQLLE